MERERFNNDRRGFRPRWKPVKEDQELDVTIESVGDKGDGVAKIDGFIVFVPETKEGDKVKVKITRVLKNMAFAEVIGEGSDTPAEEPVKEEVSNIDDAPEEQAKEPKDVEEEISRIDGAEEIPQDDIEKDFSEDVDREGHEVNRVVYD